MSLLKNPYPLPTNEDDKNSSRFQSYISAEDKALLSSLRPVKGTAQAIVNHLINNICHDLRDLGIHFYRPDADDILAIVCERRPLTDDQIVRLRRTTVGTTSEVPTWLQQHRRVTSVRKHSTNAPVKSGDLHEFPPKGERRHRKETPATPENPTQETTNDSTECTG
jgi:hypothetical protein